MHSDSFNPRPSPPSNNAAPAPISQSQLIELFSDPNRSLSTVAADLGLTLHDLTLYLARADVMQLLASIETVAAFRTRFVAANHLPTVVASLVESIRALGTADPITPAPPAPTPTPTRTRSADPISPDPLPALEFTRRRHETARRACSLLIRLARFAPLPINARQPERVQPSPLVSHPVPAPTGATAFSGGSAGSGHNPPATPRPAAPRTGQVPPPEPHSAAGTQKLIDPFSSPPTTRSVTTQALQNPSHQPRPSHASQPLSPLPPPTSSTPQRLSARQMKRLERRHAQTATPLPQPAS